MIGPRIYTVRKPPRGPGIATLPQQLRADIRNDPPRRKAAQHRNRDGDRGIDVCSRNGADGRTRVSETVDPSSSPGLFRTLLAAPDRTQQVIDRDRIFRQRLGPSCQTGAPGFGQLEASLGRAGVAKLP